MAVQGGEPVVQGGEPAVQGCEPAVQGGQPVVGVDLAALLVRDPRCTLLLRVSGPSMQGAGIDDGDLLLVDCGLDPRPGHVVLARLADGFTVKRLVRAGGGLALAAAHPAYPLLPLAPDGDHQLLGVARHVIRRG